MRLLLKLKNGLSKKNEKTKYSTQYKTIKSLGKFPRLFYFNMIFAHCKLTITD